jgi:hemoglobin-like flavoprotein
MITTVDTTELTKSLGRAHVAGDLIDRFYEIFLASNSAIAPRFADTDFEEQKRLLKQGLNLAIMRAGGDLIGASGIDRIRKSHARSRLDIPPNLYPYWKSSIMQALREMDSEWSPQLEGTWDTVLQATIDHIVGGYDAG